MYYKKYILVKVFNLYNVRVPLHTCTSLNVLYTFISLMNRSNHKISSNEIAYYLFIYVQGWPNKKTFR